MDEVKRDFPRFFNNIPRSFDEVLQSLGMPEKTRQIVEGYWQYIGIPADNFNMPFFAYMLVTYVEDGAYTPVQRSHGLSSALVKNIEDHGGKIWFNTEVSQIIIENGKVIGVQVGDQQVLAHEVICNAVPNTVYANMLPQSAVPVTALKLANARQLGETNFMVYLGLNKSPEELGIKDYSVFISDTGNSHKQYDGMKTMDHNNFIIMDCLNIADPTCSPAGTTILYETKLFQNGAWDHVSAEKYPEVKRQVASDMIRQYEATTEINIHDAFEEIEIAAPETFARYMRTPNGATYGYYGQTWDQIFGRMLNFPQEAQPLPHLYFCGGHSFMLDGYSSAYLTGYAVAEMACADIDKQAK